MNTGRNKCSNQENQTNRIFSIKLILDLKEYDKIY